MKRERNTFSDVHKYCRVREEPFFERKQSVPNSKYTEEDIIKIDECLVENICVVFTGKFFQRTVGCAPLLTDLYFYARTKQNSEGFTFGRKETHNISVQLHI